MGTVVSLVSAQDHYTIHKLTHGKPAESFCLCMLMMFVIITPQSLVCEVSILSGSIRLVLGELWNQIPAGTRSQMISHLL